ncbi:MAG TPA: hypothetical protein VGH28_12320, partial [Polyangiaceae bacterium]
MRFRGAIRASHVAPTVAASRADFGLSASSSALVSPLPVLAAGRASARAAHERDDGVDDPRPRGAREIVGHSFYEEQLCARDGGCRGSPAAHVAHRVGCSVHDEGRKGQPPETLGAVAGRNGCNGLPRDSERVVVAVPGASGTLTNEIEIVLEARRAEGAREPNRTFPGFDAIRGTRPGEDLARIGPKLAD